MGEYLSEGARCIANVEVAGVLFACKEVVGDGFE